MYVRLEQHGRVAVVMIDNPPVNAMSRAVRERLWSLAEELDADPATLAVVVAGAGRLFVGGADITEFDRPVEPPFLPDLIARIEGAAKPWIAALHGAALGGGLELALGCRFRVAAPGAEFGLPEVELGIIPGAGGTQRLPRLVGVETAIAMVAEGRRLSTDEALRRGLVDRAIPGDLLSGAVAFAAEAAAAPQPPSASARSVETGGAAWDAAAARIRKRAKGERAPLAALAALRHGVEHGFADGIAHERAAFLALRASDEAAALRRLFLAERAALRPADLRGVEPLPVGRVGVVGGGTMGVGIAAALRNAGLPVVLIERDEAGRTRARQALAGTFEAAARRGAVTAAEAAARLAGVSTAVDYGMLADCDLVIEAVYEDIEVKRAVFAALGATARADAVLATNTSYLDPRLIAASLPDPGRFLGLHFFSPAQVMRLLEIVPTPETRPEVLATAYALARRLGKIPVRSAICDGFIGNRILRRQRGEAEALVLSGVAVEAVDAAMRGFGFAMGPFETQDLAGLDISYMQREAARARGEAVPVSPGDILVRAGRKGQKTGGGWYDYASGDRTPRVSPEADRLLGPLRAGPRTMADREIVDRLIAAMAAEGRAILDEGIAARAVDIDLVEVHGYGFPRRRGGPMFLAARGAF
jgi:3-hydroxyacyl-CoA dehydrogenase